jgi:hypothetical protein
MTNFIMLDSKTLQLPAGIFGGVSNVTCYVTGELEGIRLAEKNVLLTHAGELIPAFNETTRRKNKYSVEFYKSGMVKAVALDEQQEITTPIGEFPAELITFYESGELKRFFPLDGKISGFWSEAEEREMNIPFSFDLGFSQFKAMLNGVAFFKSGSLRSVTLYPGETIQINTLYGLINARNGFSLYETGELESMEPAFPVHIDTPIGRIRAFDQNAIGLSADSCSLAFEPDGRVKKLTTDSTRIIANGGDSGPCAFEPTERPNPLDDESTVVDGLELHFDYESDLLEIISDGSASVFPLDPAYLACMDTNATQAFTCAPSACASCQMCSFGTPGLNPA